MDNTTESRAKVQEADAVVQQIVTIANPSRPPTVQTTKAAQAQQLKFAITNQNKAELERCIITMEETAANAQRRLEELEPKSIQLVQLIKYIKEALARESIGLANNTNFEEEKLAKAQRDLAEVTEQITREKREMQNSILNAKNQFLQLEIKIGTTPDTQQNTVFTPEEEAVIQQEERNLKALEDKLARLLEISEHNNEEFNEKHKLVLNEIESVQKLITDTMALNQTKQEALAHENKKTEELEKTMRDLEKKLAALRE